MSVKKSETALAERIGRKKLRGIKYLLLAVPFLIYVFAFSYVPLVGWIYSVFDYKIGQKFLDFGSMVFVGLGNFQKLFTERSEVLRVLRNTLALSALGLLATPVPVVFAIMSNSYSVVRSTRKNVQKNSADSHYDSKLYQLDHCLWCCFCFLFCKWICKCSDAENWHSAACYGNSW